MVRTGLSVFLETRLPELAGQRVGLVSHAAAVLPDLTGIVDALRSAHVKVSTLFGPEHGFSGSAVDGAAVGHTTDRRTGLPVYSLYAAAKEALPDKRMLANLDALVVDFQDVGVRFYTYSSTLYFVLQSAGQAGMPVFVFDRPNPVNGIAMEGPLLQPGFESFVGMLHTPVRHGLTLGELALFMNHEYRLNAPLTVVPMQGWQRAMWFDQTGLPWVIPSPAMPSLSTATVYPGMCFLEGTNLSEGRGTALPFELAGAPWLDGYALADRLNRRGLRGVRFRPHTFLPASSKYAGQMCEGVQVHVVDRSVFEPLRVGLHLLAACRQLAPEEFTFLPAGPTEGHPHFDLLAGSSKLREHLQAYGPVDDLVATWAPDLNRFAKTRQPYLLYH